MLVKSAIVMEWKNVNQSGGRASNKGHSIHGTTDRLRGCIDDGICGNKQGLRYRMQRNAAKPDFNEA